MFVLRDLQQLATTPTGMSAWGYRTTDSEAEVTAKGYFNGAASRVRPGDRIHCFTTGGPNNGHFDLAVTYVAKTTVNVSVLAAVR